MLGFYKKNSAAGKTVYGCFLWYTLISGNLITCEWQAKMRQILKKRKMSPGSFVALRATCAWLQSGFAIQWPNCSQLVPSGVTTLSAPYLFKGSLHHRQHL